MSVIWHFKKGIFHKNVKRLACIVLNMPNTTEVVSTEPQSEEEEIPSNKHLNDYSTINDNEIIKKSGNPKTFSHGTLVDKVASLTSNTRTSHRASLNESQILVASAGYEGSSESSILEECRKRKILIGDENLAQKKLKDNDTAEDSDFGLEKLFSAEQQNSRNKVKKNRKKTFRPNYFLSVRVQSKKVHKKVDEIHKHIQEKNNILKHCFVAVPTLHLTLFVMTLKDTNEVQKAIDALNLSTSEISIILKKFENKMIQFKGLNSFNGQVVFINSNESPGIKFLEELIDVFKSSYSELNLDFKNDIFTPHVTIMKTSKCHKILKKSGIKRIPEKLYEKYKNVNFGSQDITCVELCSMNDKKGSDGFYKVLAKVNIENSANISLLSSNDAFTVVDLSSYEIVPHQNKYLENFEFGSSWHEITEEEVSESKQADEDEVKEEKD